ncbi:MAG: potassium channel protein [Planctomycetes bacterium]|nr:potassium channel protein [Planctomycetota bacterium]NQU49557.1 potassium channel protein [Planctomycetota bacterium]
MDPVKNYERRLHRREIQRLLWLSAVVILGGTVGFHLVEGWPWHECLYMVIITISTVGFREVHEPSPAGMTLVTSIIVGGLFISLKAANLIGGTMLSTYQLRNLKKMQRLIDEMSGHVILCGYGRLGKIVRHELDTLGKEYVVISDDEDCLQELTEIGVPCLIGDATTEESLMAAGIQRASGVIAAISSDAGNVFITLSARQLNPHCPIVVRAENTNTEKKLKMVGATSVVTPYQLGGKRLAQAFLRPGAVGLADLALGSTDNEVLIQEIELPTSFSVGSSTLRKLDLGNQYGLIAIGVRRPGREDLVFNPGADFELIAHDHLLVMGRQVDVDRFRKSFGK